jgi:Pseudouridine synthase
VSSPAAEGLLLIDKPQGITSHDAVAIVRGPPE